MRLEVCDMYVKILKVLGIIYTLTITCSPRLASFAVGGSVGVAKRTKEKWKGCHLGYDTHGRI